MIGWARRQAQPGWPIRAAELRTYLQEKPLLLIDLLGAGGAGRGYEENQGPGLSGGKSVNTATLSISHIFINSSSSLNFFKM